jgi:hypothetical protein
MRCTRRMKATNLRQRFGRRTVGARPSPVKTVHARSNVRLLNPLVRREPQQALSGLQLPLQVLPLRHPPTTISGDGTVEETVVTIRRSAARFPWNRRLRPGPHRAAVLKAEAAGSMWPRGFTTTITTIRGAITRTGTGRSVSATSTTTRTPGIRRVTTLAITAATPVVTTIRSTSGSCGSSSHRDPGTCMSMDTSRDAWTITMEHSRH